MSKNAFVAVTGRPNAGKSSLTNLLVGEKISIVSEKPQTTRNKINGILTRGDTQYVFTDTPGMMRARNRLNEHMVKSVREAVSSVDCAVLMADATKKISNIERELARSFEQNGTQAILLLNKIDLIGDKEQLLPIIAEFSRLFDFEEIIPISVKRRINTEKILPALDKFAVEGEHFFPEDIATDRTERFLCAELIREKILWTMQQEIPHGTAVDIEEFKTRKKSNGAEDILDLSAVIICEKNSHKGMIIGKGGERLKQIGSLARKDIEDLLGLRVNLKLFVKVKEDWRSRESIINEYNLADDD